MTPDTDKLIRQLSLVAYLMAERRSSSARDVKQSVEGYADMSDEAFARRFYADRSELLALGVPIQSQRDEFTGEELYTLRSESYFLPAVHLSDDELAALSTAVFLLEGKFAYAEPLRLALQNLALGRPTRRAGRCPGSACSCTAPATPPRSPSGCRSSRPPSRSSAPSSSPTGRSRATRRACAPSTRTPSTCARASGTWSAATTTARASAPSRSAASAATCASTRGASATSARRPSSTRTTGAIASPGCSTRARTRRGCGSRPRPPGWSSASSGRHGELSADGSELTTRYSNLRALARWIVELNGKALPLEPAELVDEVTAGLERVVDAHEGPPPLLATQVGPPIERPATTEQAEAPVLPERFAVLQALLAQLLAACGDQPRGTIGAGLVKQRFKLDDDSLDSHLQLLNLVNFGGGCYALYAELVDDGQTIAVEKELYGEEFRRPARLSPLEAKALLLALDVIGPLVAADAHTSLGAVREKVEAAFGRYETREVPAPLPGGASEGVLSVLTDAIRDRQLIEIDYLKRESDELERRVVEPHFLRGERGEWLCDTWDRGAGGERTFRVDRIRAARPLGEAFARREDLAERAGAGELANLRHHAELWFAPRVAALELERRSDIDAPGGRLGHRRRPLRQRRLVRDLRLQLPGRRRRDEARRPAPRRRRARRRAARPRARARRRPALMLQLGEAAVELLLPPLDAVALARRCLVELAEGSVELPPKLAIHPRADAFVNVMPAYLRGPDLAGVKLVAAYPRNRALGLPAISATVVLWDVETRRRARPGRGRGAHRGPHGRRLGRLPAAPGAGGPGHLAITGAGVEARSHLRVASALGCARRASTTTAPPTSPACAPGASTSACRSACAPPPRRSRRSRARRSSSPACRSALRGRAAAGGPPPGRARAAARLLDLDRRAGRRTRRRCCSATTRPARRVRGGRALRRVAHARRLHRGAAGRQARLAGRRPGGRRQPGRRRARRRLRGRGRRASARQTP